MRRSKGRKARRDLERARKSRGRANGPKRVLERARGRGLGCSQQHATGCWLLDSSQKHATGCWNPHRSMRKARVGILTALYMWQRKRARMDGSRRTRAGETAAAAAASCASDALTPLSLRRCSVFGMTESAETSAPMDFLPRGEAVGWEQQGSTRATRLSGERNRAATVEPRVSAVRATEQQSQRDQRAESPNGRDGWRRALAGDALIASAASAAAATDAPLVAARTALSSVLR